MADNYFKQLYDIDVSNKIKNKSGINYVSWAAAWAEVKKAFPDATYKVYEHLIKIVKKTETEEKLENIQERTEQRLSNLHKKLKDLEDEISQLTAEKEDIESKLRVFETALEKL